MPTASSKKPRLRRTFPHSVRDRLSRLGVEREEVLLSVPTDHALSPGSDIEWIIATRERLLVLNRRGEPGEELDLHFADLASIEVEQGVGAGLIRATLGARIVDVAQYSLSHSHVFTRLAARLEQLRRGEDFTPPDEEHDPTRCSRCGLRLSAAGDSCPRCVDRQTVLLRVIKLLHPHLRGAILMLALLLAGVALDLVSPQLTRLLVDDVLGVGAAASPLEAVEALGVVVAILAAVQTTRALVNIFNGRLAARIGTAVTYDIRARLVERLQQLSVGFYDRQQIGSLVGRVAYDTEAMHGFIWQLTGGFILQLVMVFGVFAMMFTLDWRLALLALLPAPLVMGGTIYFWKRIYPRYYRSWEASSRQAGALTGMLGGVRVVKLFGQERREATRFNENSRRLRSARLGVDNATAVFGGIVGLFFQMGGWIVWFVGGRQVLEGALTLGELMAFFGYLWMFYGPLASLPQLTNWFTQFTTQTSRVFEILDTPEAILPSENPIELEEVRGAIAFEHVTFGYDRHSPVIRDLSLRIQAGERIGIVGSSGSGKSSLIQLLCRFYDPSEGHIALDGVDIRRLPKDRLRRSIGVVLQEPILFHGSIADNITYGDLSASPQRIIETAIAADCHDFILKQPHAYDTWLGERGAGLSGGERQRVGIARTLLADPPIIVLDEATSSIDATSEALIRTALQAWTHNRTTIAIAHRLAALRDMSRVIVIEAGKIVEDGAPAALLAGNGAFARLCRAQGLEAFEPPTPESPRTANWLDPAATRITPDFRGVLKVRIGDSEHAGVYAIPCMPVHHPARVISLRRGRRDARGSEVGLISSLDDWPAEAADLVRRSLARRYFLHVIRRIHSIELEQDYLQFAVATDTGPQTFMTRWRPESVQEHGPDGRLIVDSDGEHFLIQRISSLPRADRELLDRYVYW